MFCKDRFRFPSRPWGLASGQLHSTHWSRWRFSRRATGLPWNLTFAEAVEQISVGDSGRLQVPSIDRERIPVERRHLKAAYSRCRPQAAGGIFQAERPHHSGSCRSRIRTRNPCQEIAVVQGSCGPANNGSRMNDCCYRLRTGAADPKRAYTENNSAAESRCPHHATNFDFYQSPRDLNRAYGCARHGVLSQ